MKFNRIPYYKHFTYIVFAIIATLVIGGCNSRNLITGEFPLTDYTPTLSVITMYAGNDSNASNYRSAVSEWSKQTGILVEDSSVTSDETFKNRVLMDFRAGAEPDVLFYFNGTDANPLVEADKVVSLDEIRALYPDFASNMKEELMTPSLVDGKIYCIPVNGYWEGLYVNKGICDKAGVKVPDENTTWDEFLNMCESIKTAGYTPIAASLSGVPHYWFEFCVYNNQSTFSHSRVPEYVNDRSGIAWLNGLIDIKNLFDLGYFPDNTLTASDDETVSMFMEGQAAFLLDGSWKLSTLESSEFKEDFVVSYVPSKNTRRNTDIIGGLSSGYYITRKAWDDPEKRDYAVSFIRFMTRDECVSKFAGISATALVNGVKPDTENQSELTVSAFGMTKNSTVITIAVQDLLPQTARSYLFENVPNIVRGEVEIDEILQNVIDDYQRTVNK